MPIYTVSTYHKGERVEQVKTHNLEDALMFWRGEVRWSEYVENDTVPEYATNNVRSYLVLLGSWTVYAGNFAHTISKGE